MSKPVGTIKIKGYKENNSVPAFRIGKFWGVNSSGDNSPYFNLTHLPTGQSLTAYIGIRQAKRLVGVLDVLFPFQTNGEIGQVWVQLSERTQAVLRGDV